MARSFKGRGSEELYNSELYKLFEVTQHIIDTPDDPSVGPITNRNGALWLDRSQGSSADLKYRNDGKWETIYADRFKMICEILSPEEPDKPVSGQLWLNDGILMYYSGSEWVPVKSVNVAAEFNLSAFEQFLIISPMEAAGNKVVTEAIDPNLIQTKPMFVEEECDMQQGESTITLTKEYTVGSRSINVYVDGIRIPASSFEEVDSTTIELKTPLQKDSHVLVEFVAMDGVIESIEQINTFGKKTQFLLPSVELDRFFIDGMNTTNYEEVTNVAIQYPSEELQGKYASGVHVNPKKLVNIKKRLFLVDPNNPIIPVTEQNTEYYGFKDGIGKFLLKRKYDTEYSSVASGIKLSPSAANLYDMVGTITYEFKDVKGSGSMKKGKVNLSETTSVHIGNILDPLCVFTQGMYLSEDPRNYVYEDGYIKLKLQTTMDLGIIAFPKKEIGEISNVNSNGDGIIHINGDYNRPLVFVYGLDVDHALADFEYDAVDPKTIYVKNARVGWHYAIVDTEVDDPAEQMFYKAGTIEKDPYTNDYYIPIDPSTITEDDSIILFVNGFLMMKDDVTIDSANNRIDIAGGFADGLEYVLLKDEFGRFLFSDFVSFNTIPIGTKADSVLLYVENQLASDASAVYTSKLPKKGYHGELKQLLTNTSSDWYKYNAATSKWEMITDSTLSDYLSGHVLGYTADGHTINILQNFGKKEAVYYAYQYANSVEEPLLRGIIKTYEDKDTYRVAFNHGFTGNTNSLSIWQNGLRQNHDTLGDVNNPNGYYELGLSQFLMPKFYNAEQGIDTYLDGIMMYVVEKPEGVEAKSCERQILTIDNIVPGTKNIFQTDIPLIPGNVRVFISGLRQPESAYKIIDNYQIMLNNEILCSPSNFPIESIQLSDSAYIDFERIHPDQILIEVRQDYALKEITLPVRYPGQKEFSIEDVNITDITKGGDGLPESIINSADFIMIYVNGMAYGKDYSIDKDRGVLILNNDTITEMLGKDPIYDYFQSNAVAYEEWRKENNGAVYEAKPITDKITFEWR